MKSYREFIKNISNIYSYREGCEWSNFWFDRATDEKSKRYLIIGDSTARMVRSTFAKLMQAPVDMLGTSSAIDDELFVNQIDAFFNNSLYRYDAIFVQLGHHSRISKDGMPYKEEDYIKFENDYSPLLKYLKQYSSLIITETVFDSYQKKSRFKTWLCRISIMKEKEDDGINNITRRKNNIIKELSLQGGVNYVDINSFMKNKKCVHVDHIHFEDKAKILIAQEMKRYLLSIIN